MGEWTLPERTSVLVWDEGEYAGAEVTVRTSIGVYAARELGRLLRRDDGETVDDASARAVAIASLLAADVVVEWNLRDHLGAIPVTADGVSRVPPEFEGELIAHYFAVLTGQGFKLRRTSGGRSTPPPDLARQSDLPTQSGTAGS